MNEKINKLNEIKEKLHEVNEGIEKAIVIQEKIVKDLMNEYSEVARWYVDNGFNYDDLYSENSNMILISMTSNNDGAYLWDPYFNNIKFFDLNHFHEGEVSELRELLNNRYFNQIIDNIKKLDYLLIDYYENENRIKNELLDEIDEYKEI